MPKRKDKVSATITVPDGMQFSELRLTIKPDGQVSYDRDAIIRVCKASGIDPHLVFGAPNNVPILIANWYVNWIKAGGAPDPAAEHIINTLRGGSSGSH